MAKGYCDDAEKCANAGVLCDNCSRNWFFEEPEDNFEEIVEEEAME